MKLKTLLGCAALVVLSGVLLPTLFAAREEKRPEPVTPPEPQTGSTIPTMTRAKVVVQSVQKFVAAENVVATAVEDKSTPENERFNKYTPSGKLELYINNPNLFGFFQPGREYYVDVTPAG